MLTINGCQFTAKSFSSFNLNDNFVLSLTIRTTGFLGVNHFLSFTSTAPAYF